MSMDKRTVAFCVILAAPRVIRLFEFYGVLPKDNSRIPCRHGTNHLSNQ